MSNHITLWKTWHEIPPFRLPSTDKELIGYSLAGLRTNFFVKPDLMLDAGLSAPLVAKNILITHGHSDHIANLPYHLYRQTESSNINIYCPKHLIKLINNYIVSMFQLSEGNEQMLPSNYTIIGIDKSDSGFAIDIGKSKHIVEIFNCDHSVSCIGYGISSIKNKLKSEYTGLSGKEIKQLKSDGVDVTNTIYVPEFVFLGDTTHHVFLSEPNILNYKTVICECTFLTEDDLSHAEEKKHMNWINLKPIVQANPNVTFILTHFSRKYTKEFVDTLFEKELRENGILNIKLWCNLV
jgi:ribonuclease Z